jgi:hypothetical protein
MDASRLQAEILLLDELTAAQSNLLSWYETEMERLEYDDDLLPQDFVELEQSLEEALQKLLDARKKTD